MEAFEKWWRNLSSICLQRKCEFEEVWKAALEWMYNQLGYSEDDKRIKDIIEKELGKK
jgi:hypothetical protein